jgi:hypothetical protein
MYMPTEKMVLTIKEGNQGFKNASNVLHLTILHVERECVDQHQEPYAKISAQSPSECIDWILDASQFWLLEYLSVGETVSIMDYFVVDGFVYTEQDSIVLFHEPSKSNNHERNTSPTSAIWGTVIGHVPHDELNPMFTIGLVIRSEKGTETVFFQGSQGYQAAKAQCGHYVFAAIKQGLLGTPIARNRLYNVSRIPSIPNSTLCPISPLTVSTEFKFVDALLASMQQTSFVSLRNPDSYRFMWTKSRAH